MTFSKAVIKYIVYSYLDHHVSIWQMQKQGNKVLTYIHPSYSRCNMLLLCFARNASDCSHSNCEKQYGKEDGQIFTIVLKYNNKLHMKPTYRTLSRLLCQSLKNCLITTITNANLFQKLILQQSHPALNMKPKRNMFLVCSVVIVGTFSFKCTDCIAAVMKRTVFINQVLDNSFRPDSDLLLCISFTLFSWRRACSRHQQKDSQKVSYTFFFWIFFLLSWELQLRSISTS